jgi:ABC-2 type transport system permease protein
MNKFLAIVKREYLQRVRSKLFIVMTILGPVLLAVFTVVPTLLFSIKTGDTRVAIIDQTEGARLYGSVRNSLLTRDRRPEKVDLGEAVNSNAQERIEKTGKSFTGSFVVEQMELKGRPLDEVKAELNRRIGRGELDGYLVIPADLLKNSATEPSYYGRNVGDVFTSTQIEHGLNRAVNRQRLVNAGVREQDIDALSKPVNLATFPVNEKGEAGGKDSGGGFILSFVLGFLIYLTILMYGQVILGAVVEEKETRIAEILFSSVRSSTLMFGKLIGVSMVALTQLGIWFTAFGVLAVWGLPQMPAKVAENIPRLPASFFLYFFLFFLVGYFIYSTLYALVGSMVTTTQEGGQVAMPIIFLLMIGFYLSFMVMRSPNSSLSFWVSMFPFFSPITMVTRIVSQTPPLWQIALSLFIGFATIAGLLWLAARVHRVGMLMYGKKASIPEVMRWVRQP